MKKLIKITVILTVLCLMSCNKPHDDVADKKKIYFYDIVNENAYYSSAYAKEGNDYYYINTEYEESLKYFDMESIPSKHVIAVDSECMASRIEEGMDELVEYLPRSKTNKISISLYDIGSEDLKRYIDLKEVITEYEKKNRASLSKFQSYDILHIDGNFYMKLQVCDDFQLPKDLTEEYTEINTRSIYVNLLTKEIIEEKYIPKQNNKLQSNNMDLFRIEYYGGSDELKFYISSDKYWEGVVEAWIGIDDLNENYKKLYEKFPDLKEKVDKLKKEKKEARLFVVLTDNPSYEELAELLTEDGKELSFKDIIIKNEASVDGVEHQIYSFDEWRKYYRVDKVNESVISPIIPR